MYITLVYQFTEVRCLIVHTVCRSGVITDHRVNSLVTLVALMSLYITASGSISGLGSFNTVRQDLHLHGDVEVYLLGAPTVRLDLYFKGSKRIPKKYVY